MKTLKEKIEVMQAALDGKDIEIKFNDDINYHQQRGNPESFLWNWRHNDYRIKPEPMEFWVNVYPNGTINAFDGEQKAFASREMCHGEPNIIKVREVL